MFKLRLKKYLQRIFVKFDTNNQVCNKHNKEDFRECLKKCISVGTNFEILELFMKNHGFATYKNHGFAIEEKSIPEDITITHRSLFDKSIQGIQFDNKPAFSFQGHPEASPGPHELISLFNKFKNMIEENNA